MAEWLDLTSADEVADGEMHPVTVRGLYLGVARVGEQWFVFDEECTHEQCPLPDGDLEGTVLTCGCHGSQFDLSTGEVLTGPATEAIETYQARVRDGRVQALLPDG